MTIFLSSRFAFLTRRLWVAIAAGVVAAVIAVAAAVLPGAMDQRSHRAPGPSVPVLAAAPGPSAGWNDKQTEAWLASLPEGPTKKLTMGLVSGYAVVEGRLMLSSEEPGYLRAPLRTSAGTLVTYDPDADTINDNASLLLVSDEGVAKRVVQGQIEVVLLSPDERSFAVSYLPPIGDRSGRFRQRHIEVRDATTSRLLQRISQPDFLTFELVGWSRSGLVWSRYNDDDYEVWSWLPGLQPVKMSAGRGVSATGDLLAVTLHRNSECPRLVNLDNLNDPILPQCILAISPDGRLVATQDLGLVEVATGRVLSPDLPIDAEMEIEVVGWEQIAVVADMSYRFDEFEPLSAVTRLRCPGEEGQCETVDAPRGLPRVEVGVS